LITKPTKIFYSKQEMPIHNLNRDVMTIIFSYLDKYDANNLRMTNKFFYEEVNAIQIYHPFHTPIYRENKYGYSMIQTPSRKYESFGPQECLTWCEHRGNTSRKNSYKYIIYMNDEFGGNPYFFNELLEVQSIMNSYYTFRQGYKIQKEFLENKKKKEVIIKKNTFLIKGTNGGKITNPWKKVY
jgi:hypothetical protein